MGAMHNIERNTTTIEHPDSQHLGVGRSLSAFVEADVGRVIGVGLVLLAAHKDEGAEYHGSDSDGNTIEDVAEGILIVIIIVALIGIGVGAGGKHSGVIGGVLSLRRRRGSVCFWCEMDNNIIKMALGYSCWNLDFRYDRIR